MRERKLTSAQEECLRAQTITADQPGTVLRDFRMLLDFLGPQGVESGGKYNLLPMKFIDELDSRLSRPLVLKMKRPLLRSHPYLQGLNLRLRASGLSRIEGIGSKSRLVLDSAMLIQWNGLNPTEQYFNLLEACLRVGRAEMVGEEGRGWGGNLFMDCLQTWKSLPEKGNQFDTKRPQDVYLLGIGRRFYPLALMDMFGLLDVEQPRQPIATWVPAGINHVPFGDAVFTLLDSQFLADLLSDPPPEEGEDQEGAESMQPRFGAWQPLFQPDFPEWRQNLEFPEPEPRTGRFLFRVSLGKVWRLIAMPAESTLDDLVAWILRSVKFDSDHLYKFEFRDRLGTTVRVNHPEMDEGPWTSEISIGTLPLEPGQSMKLIYDFGDYWNFTVKLERIESPAAKVKAPAIIEKHGKSPEQYPNWDD